MNFEEKVKALSAKEIIMAMVIGLQKEYIKVNMNYFSGVIDGVCFGCAATNALCHISGVVFNKDTIRSRPETVNCGYSFLMGFEYAINDLRKGNIKDYNQYAQGHGFAGIIPNGEDLPCLHTDDYKDNLHHYISLAESQPS